MTVVPPRIEDKILQISIRGSELLPKEDGLPWVPYARIHVTQVMALFRTNMLPQKNGLHAGHLPANPLLTSLPRSRMMRSMYRRTTCMQSVLIVMNTTIVRRVVPG